MSSELLEDVEDEYGMACLLSMQASGHAQLTLMDADDETAMFHFTPDADGLKKAETIEKALAAWRAQVARTRV